MEVTVVTVDVVVRQVSHKIGHSSLRTGPKTLFLQSSAKNSEHSSPSSLPLHSGAGVVVVAVVVPVDVGVVIAVVVVGVDVADVVAVVITTQTPHSNGHCSRTAGPDTGWLHNAAALVMALHDRGSGFPLHTGVVDVRVAVVEVAVRVVSVAVVVVVHVPQSAGHVCLSCLPKIGLAQSPSLKSAHTFALSWTPPQFGTVVDVVVVAVVEVFVAVVAV